VDSAPAAGPDRVADAPKPDTRAAVQPVRSLPSHSIRARLYAVFAILLLLVLGLGVFGVARLADVNRVSEVIRNHWLQATRILGDVSNYMSDYRTAEGSHLLSTTPLELAASDKEILALGETVERSQRAYEAVPHGPAESVLYAQFAEQWRAGAGARPRGPHPRGRRPLHEHLAPRVRHRQRHTGPTDR
jgi:hypothetical protein